MNSLIGNSAKKRRGIVKKVYVITKGEYSDYRICAIYSNKEKAEGMVNLFSDEWAQATIEEWPLDIFPSLDKIRYIVFVRKNGDVANIITRRDELLSAKDFKNYVVDWEGEGGWVFQIWAKDEKHAIKIAGEWRRKLLSEEKAGVY